MLLLVVLPMSDGSRVGRGQGFLLGVPVVSFRQNGSQSSRPHVPFFRIPPEKI